MKIAVLLMLMMAVSGVQAQLAKSLEFEQKLEQRIFRQIQSVDPSAQVLVKIKLKESKVKLPGVTFDYFGSTGVEEIQAEDIQAIEIKIISALSPFPEWLATDVRTRHTFAKIVPTVVTQQFEPETLRVIKERDPISQTADRVFNTMRDSLPQILAVLGLVVAVVMTGFALLVNWMVRVWRSQMARLLSALDNRAGGSAVEAQARQEAASEAASAGDGAALDLPEEGVTELMADCYWTENDGYARWVWDHLTNVQRQALLKNWEPMEAYAKFLRKQPSLAQDHHQHPYYLNPMSLKTCGQKDLAEYVQKEKGAWLTLPPMRQESLDLPLETKVRLTEAKTAAKGAPRTQSKPRALDFVVSWGQLSAEDEALLWKDPDFIPRHLWKSLNTLVWVARLDLEERRDLLNKFSAADLAQCWIGPDEVLAGVREALPEKKLKLVESYAANVKPRRSGEVFTRLSSEAAVRLAGREEESHVQKAA